MTKVTMERDGASGWYTLQVAGHATGSKALCAAVSCLVQSLEGWLGAYDERAEVLQAEKASGRAYFRFREWDRDACRGVWELLKAGFLRLAATEPKKISVEIKNNP